MKLLISAFIMSLSFAAMATVNVDCGNGLNEDTSTLSQVEVSITSPTGDFSGPAGKKWIATNGKGQVLKGASIQKINDDLILVIASLQGMGGPVGVKYIIINPKINTVVPAKKVAVGGFAGGAVVGHLDCVITKVN